MTVAEDPETSPRRPDSAIGPVFGEKLIGRVNWIGLQTLCLREVRRFMKVWTQTVAAPAITTLLFMAVFTVALGSSRGPVGGVPFQDFLAPGLMIMAVLQNAFANTSSSIMISKVQGNIVDVLMPPLSSTELALGFAIGGVVRGLAVGFAVWIALTLAPGVSVTIAHPWAVLYFALMASSLMSLAGVLTGIWAEKFDHTAAITNFIVAPLTLLSGTFYSIKRLGETWQTVSEFNPFFYLIDGFRYGFLGTSDSNIVVGMGVSLALVTGLWFWVWIWLDRGYKIKS